MVLYPNKLPESERVCFGICKNLLNITEDGVKYNLSRFQELGLLKRVGGRKHGYWQILE